MPHRPIKVEWKRHARERLGNTRGLLRGIEYTNPQSWDATLTGFRPISVNSDQTSIKIAFHWLLTDSVPKETDGDKEGKITFGERPYTPEQRHRFSRKSPGKCTSSTNNSKRRYNPVTTDHPVEKPLPSFDLLGLLWHLTRIASMLGGGENDDSDGDSDDNTNPAVQFMDPSKEPPEISTTWP
ncbi:uncharacterized protein N7483_003947 [Penicillium malachiteum]|uniref:uncharacterized protein n=1 Tax=Penicillium malachiteum TaxID=1324776 RepID=UPI00254933B1|nr:uncharacterized protein N7483_003947 [Penicillium malachiteum]KAJ5729439.1 hypothetical protein N7483_003947 [Penicillium malachiteum]